MIPRKRAKREKTDYIDKDKLTAEINGLQMSKKLVDNIEMQKGIKSGELVKELQDKVAKLNGKKLKIATSLLESIESGAKYPELVIEKKQLLEDGAVLDYSKQEFGRMVLLIINNLMKKHCFSGYTENWTEDFKSNAIYKIFRYIHNFDSERISEVTGKKVSSFAYLTQITYMAFLEVINKRKAENELMFRTMIPLQDVKVDYYTQDKGVNVSAMEMKHEDDKLTTIYIDPYDLKTKSLYELMKNIRETNECVQVYYPEDYSSPDHNDENVKSISIDEYDDIIKLDFKILRIKKDVKVIDEMVDEDESACFIVQDEFDESWEWEEE